MLFGLSVFKHSTKSWPQRLHKGIGVCEDRNNLALGSALPHHYLRTCASTQRFVELNKPDEIHQKRNLDQV
jgi:hypothetical protein